MTNLPELEPLTESLFFHLRSASGSAARLADLLAVCHDIISDSAGLWKPDSSMVLEDLRFYIIRSVTTRTAYKPVLARWDRIGGWIVEQGHLETNPGQFDTIQVLV